MTINLRYLILAPVLAIHTGAIAQIQALQCAKPEIQTSAPTETIAREYLVQEVCTDSNDKAIPIDPCQCNSPNHLRDLRPGEPLTYHKVDQQGVQRHDSYPDKTPGGGEIIVNPFDFRPFEQFNPAGDGYDVYEIRDGWVSVSETKDGGGFAQTFFGEGCKPYLGWVLFPLSAFSASGVTPGTQNIPISGRYWEQNGEPWPGSCPSAYNKNSQTSWKYIAGFVFGGRDEGSAKRIDAIQVTHGFSATPQFAAHGHLEVFYFTRLYGITRWESWVSASGGAPSVNSGNCSGDDKMTYAGLEFSRKACRDWSAVSLEPKPAAHVVWPIPALNLLKNFHFADGTVNWDRRGKSVEGNLVNWTPRNSSLDRDTRFRQQGGKGVRYLAINCGGHCTENQAVFQDVPVTSAAGTGPYTFAATIRSEDGAGEIQLRIRQFDATGKELQATGTTAHVDDKNERFSGADSVLLASGFVSGTFLPDSRSRLFRFEISPMTGNTFDVVDAWLIRN